MILGTVSAEGTPTIDVVLGGRTWRAIIDTGFNGDVELPEELRSLMHARYLGQSESILATGQSVLEDVYEVDFPFDGRTMTAQASFAPCTDILIGTHLLREHHLSIHFPDQSVQIDRAL